RTPVRAGRQDVAVAEEADLEVLTQAARPSRPGRAGPRRLGQGAKATLAGVAVGLAISVALAWSPSGPARVVAVTSDFRLVVLDRDGRELRQLAADVSVTRGLPRLAVAPDRRTAYVDRARPSRPGERPVPGGIDDIVA